MFENVTLVPGSSARITVGLLEQTCQRLSRSNDAQVVQAYPSVTLHGPALPVSSHVMLPLGSFQIDMARTIPRSIALPICARPPLAWKAGAVALQYGFYEYDQLTARVVRNLRA